jgi:hypothetical protein
MNPGEQFRFMCKNDMAARINKPITLAGGKVIDQDVRSYGVVITVRK